MLFFLFMFSFPSFARASDLEYLCMNAFHEMPTYDASYKPGVDVYGNKVVSADLYSNNQLIPDVVTVPLTRDLATRFIDMGEGVAMEAVIGDIQIYPDGKVIFNNQDITKSAREICQTGDTENKIVLPPAQSNMTDSNENIQKNESNNMVEDSIIYGEGY
jgi:hypothetical protein